MAAALCAGTIGHIPFAQEQTNTTGETVQLSGADGGTGQALVEVYEVP